MKRIMYFIVVILISLGLYGCVRSDGVLINVISNESVENSAVSSSAPNEHETETLKKQIKELEEQINTLKNQSTESVLKVINLNDKNRLYLVQSGYEYVLKAQIGDQVAKIHNDYYISKIEASPDCSKVIFNDFQMEARANVYLYDVKTQQKKELSMSELPKNTTASFMKWLDNRYFLFVGQLDHGSVVRGGDLYVYDTETDKYKKIIGTEDEYTQISSFDVYGDSFILVTCEVYEETWNDTIKQYYTVPIDEISNLISNNKTTTLKK